MPKVKVADGILQGKLCTTFDNKNYYSFEGIPYAKPPIGKLRFQAPQPPEKWEGVKDATKPGDRCAQLNPYSNKGLEGSEDCLYLNVYTPILPSDKIAQLPVLFYVHGGRLIVGYGDYYRPDYFIRHDVVIVTINYRLNILGYLCLNIPEAPGNAGLKDTIMALRWVKNNINQFGGDPNNVTVIGESAGSGIVTSYLTSKMADGLFNKVIAESGTCLSDLYMVDENPVEKGIHIASLLGKELKDAKSVYDLLIDLPLEDLISTFALAEISQPPYSIRAYFLPVVEKKFQGVERYFEEYPMISIKKRQHKKVPMLVGLNSHEGALFLQKDENGQIAFETDLQNFIPCYLFLNHDSPKKKQLANKLLKFYFQGKEIDDSTKYEYLDFVSDAYFNRDITIMLEVLCQSCDTYFYSFNYDGEMNTRVMKNLGMKGASHSDILQYQFYRKAKADKCTERDRKVVDFLSESWTAFAKNGNPSIPNGIKWLPYTANMRNCLIIEEQQKSVIYPYWDRIKVWLDNMGERSKL